MLPKKVEHRLASLFKLELSLAGKIEVLKQDLVESFDFNADRLWLMVDDCNLKFIDCTAMKRFI